MTSWLKRKWSWAGQNPLFWCNLALGAVVIAFVFFLPAPGAGDFRVRTVGMLLQLVGVLTVWLDLTSTARQFGKSGVLRSTWNWLKIGVLGQPHVLGASCASFAAFTGGGRMKQRTPVNPSAPLPDRLAAIEAVLAEIDRSVDHAFDEIERRSAQLSQEIKDEASKRATQIADTNRSLESATAGNFVKLAFGAFWLAVGVVLATWAPEIAKLVGGQEILSTL